jgi:hypothetical protein
MRKIFALALLLTLAILIGIVNAQSRYHTNDPEAQRWLREGDNVAAENKQQAIGLYVNSMNAAHEVKDWNTLLELTTRFLNLGNTDQARRCYDYAFIYACDYMSYQVNVPDSGLDCEGGRRGLQAVIDMWDNKLSAANLPEAERNMMEWDRNAAENNLYYGCRSPPNQSSQAANCPPQPDKHLIPDPKFLPECALMCEPGWHFNSSHDCTPNSSSYQRGVLIGQADLPAEKDTPTDVGIVLEKGMPYFVVGEGVCSLWNGQNDGCDSVYRYRTPLEPNGGEIKIWGQLQLIDPSVHLSDLIEEDTGKPAEYNPSHIYESIVVGEGKALKARVFDGGGYGDNHGTLYIKIYEAKPLPANQ